MNMESATSVILEAEKRMQALYGAPVFDEFAIVHRVGDELYLRWYFGGRRAEFIRDFESATRPLWQESLSRFVNRYEIGDFEFVREAASGEAGAFLVLGEDLYLLCTNTGRSMPDITGNPLWLQAQEEFVGLSEVFGSHPLKFVSLAGCEQVALRSPATG